MRAFLVGIIGIAIVIASTPISPLLGSGGSAKAWTAGLSARFDSHGKRLSSHEARMERIKARRAHANRTGTATAKNR